MRVLGQRFAQEADDGLARGIVDAFGDGDDAATVMVVGRLDGGDERLGVEAALRQVDEMRAVIGELLAQGRGRRDKAGVLPITTAIQTTGSALLSRALFFFKQRRDYHDLLIGFTAPLEEILPPHPIDAHPLRLTTPFRPSSTCPRPSTCSRTIRGSDQQDTIFGSRGGTFKGGAGNDTDWQAGTSATVGAPADIYRDTGGYDRIIASTLIGSEGVVNLIGTPNVGKNDKASTGID